ncbi:ABC transporter permease [Clostridium sp. AF50-3]|uniref:ABC transporter permease n=1 Tax=unclassified Clostridium TaxID=2614128 RepID=UPI001FAB2318|nr:ABC transporter permease [Clostridium sp. AF50-3]
MKKYIGKRIMISLVTLLIIILVLFMLLQLMPGSPFNDEKLTADQIAMMSKKYGLDKPLIVQFFTYVKNLLQGDFGVSYVISKDTSISVLLKNRVPVSFGIGLEAVSFGAVVGLILGILAALKKNSWLDTICTVISVLGVSFRPMFLHWLWHISSATRHSGCRFCLTARSSSHRRSCRCWRCRCLR